MVTHEPSVYDVVGIGFGPSNLSLAIALEDLGGFVGSGPVTAKFFERQSEFGWHKNMLLPSAKMQVSFLKDLVTFRNPYSRYSFVSYLHSVDRLTQFVNNCDFFPTRQEFHKYLEWVASYFTDKVSYGTEVTAITPLQGEYPGEPIDGWRVHVSSVDNPADSYYVDARNLVLATGLVPKMPENFVRDDHVWHSSEFLGKFQRCDATKLTHIAVVGAGQSAAEIARHCYDYAPNATVSVIIPSYGYSIADSTPFANQVFDPEAVDAYYYGEEQAKNDIWKYHKNTNYGVVDDEVIRSLYQRKYDDEVRGVERLQFIELSRVTGVKRSGDDTRITVYSLASDQYRELDVDAIVCATGYESMNIGAMFGDIDGYFKRDSQDRYRLERDYRLITSETVQAGVYLQGGTEHSHGLSSSLLSNMATRSGEIAQSISENRFYAVTRELMKVGRG